MKVFVLIIVGSLFTGLNAYSNSFIRGSSYPHEKPTNEYLKQSKDYKELQERNSKKRKLEREEFNRRNDAPEFGRSIVQIENGTYPKGQEEGTIVYKWIQAEKLKNSLNDHTKSAQSVEQKACAEFIKENREKYLIQNAQNRLKQKLNKLLENLKIANEEVWESRHPNMEQAVNNYNTVLKKSMISLAKSNENIDFVEEYIPRNNYERLRLYTFYIILPEINRPLKLVIRSSPQSFNSEAYGLRKVTAKLSDIYKSAPHFTMELLKDSDKHNELIASIEKDQANNIIQTRQECGDIIINSHDLSYIDQGERNGFSKYDSLFLKIKKFLKNPSQAWAMP
jgi:3-methyladenine DNA glycosylase AlkC